MDPMSEVTAASPQRRQPETTTASSQRRSDRVLSLGIYGRAAFEWRRAMTEPPPAPTSDPTAVLAALDRTVADLVRSRLQGWLQDREDPEAELASGLPTESPVEEPQQVVAATVAIEIPLCLDRIFQPAPTSAGEPHSNGTRPTPTQRQLLETMSWLDRPSLDELARQAVDLADGILELGQDPVLLHQECEAPSLVDPVSLFPTELRFVHQVLRRRLARPVDLYQLFN